MFSATVITGISMKCWCTMPTPKLDRRFGRGNAYGLAVDADLALVGVVQPVEDVHQRRLARSVLTKQRMDLATAEVEVDVVVGEDAREGLCDPAQLEDRTFSLGHPRRDPKGAGEPGPSGTDLVRRPGA